MTITTHRDRHIHT